jgi:hypothetical protein
MNRFDAAVALTESIRNRRALIASLKSFAITAAVCWPLAALCALLARY